MKEFVKDSARRRLKYEPMDKVFRTIMYVRFWSLWPNYCLVLYFCIELR